jgi:sodium-dependent dicarboxylate transporter 2/3/5
MYRCARATIATCARRCGPVHGAGKLAPYPQQSNHTVRRIAVIIGPLLALMLGTGLNALGQPSEVCWTAGVTLLCAIWWISEAIPIPVTGLLPLAIFPLVGVLTPNEVGQAYGSPLILLYLGGFMLSMAMEKSGAHRRIALGMVNLFGGGGRAVVFGFMAAAASLSMWISNTATSLMLLPIALATLENAKDHRLKVALLLGVAYACNVGGIGTPVGTPPNLIFMQVYEDTTGVSLSFIDWMRWGLPVVVLFVPLIGFWLTRSLGAGERLVLPEVGSWRPEERRTLTIFALTAIAWITRNDPFGGWSGWLGLPQANDASVALLAVAALFLTPNGKGERLLDWDTAVRIPWGILILFSGGICIASAFVSSGISQIIGEALAALSGIPTVLLLAAICLCVTFLTEITSNTATTALLMPVLAAAAIGSGIDPRLLMVPAAMSASCAFMLPVATGPNAVIFASGHVSIKSMVKEGLALNFLGVAVLTAVSYVTLLR